MLLSNISFPVYLLGKRKPDIEDGIVFYTLKTEIDGKVEYIYDIIDDASLAGDSLSRRRLALSTQKVKLFKLKYAIFYISDLLKLTKGKTWFIDSKGEVFAYVKTRKVPLIFKKITKIIPISTGGALVEVEGINSRFKVLFRPSVEQKVAGLLRVNSGYILYGLYDKIYKNTSRRI